jgi:Flp pilus assembly protein TadG
MTDTSRLSLAASMASELGRCRRGTLILPFVLVALPLTAAVVFGVDLTRIWLVQSRLQTAVDAAALVAGRPTNTSTATADATALFWSNFERTEKPTGKGFMAAVADAPVVQRLDADTVMVTASATLEMSPLGYLSQGSKVITAQAAVKRAMYGMELALVLDVTGSMGAYTTGGTENMAGLRVAAKNLVDIIYGTAETVPNLTVSVVPYTATVNIGNTRTNWLAAGSLDQSKYGNVGWAGCVEARAGTEDRTDSLATSKPFAPYLWRSTLGKYVTTSDGKSKGGDPVKGDNDWSNSNITEANQASLPDNTAVGPNLGCPAFPILPLTAEKSPVLTKIASLRSTFRGGTMGNLGLQIGWFTLSPTWVGAWGKANSPLPYNTTNMEKVVVMMTDGNNEWYDWPGGAPGAAPVSYVGQTTDADYTAYGRLSENRLGTGTGSNANLLARDEINKRTTSLCTSMKAQGIKIYTVILGSVDASTQALWQGCATKPEYYFNSPDKAALASAFQQIGSKLASLRISQ